MKMYTKDAALQEIFSLKGDQLSVYMAVYKNRYKKGILSQKSIDRILNQYGFVLDKPAMYKLTRKRNVRN